MEKTGALPQTDVPLGSAFSADSYSSDTYRWLLVVFTLTIIYMLNFIDRQVINILIEPIKADLGLRDWQLGALTGLSFAIIYGAMALPVARLAERVHRPRLIAGALALWSGATIACAGAAGFWQLAIARLFVGVGESGYSPAAYSLMTESVPRERRTLAFGIFSTGIPFGAMIAMTAGGVVAGLYGWRMAFLVAGLPGLAMAFAALLLVEPRLHDQGSKPSARHLREDLRALFGKRSFRLFVLAGGLTAMSGYGIQAFLASFFLRNHMSQLVMLAGQSGSHTPPMAVLGPMLGLIVGVTGIFSALASGLVTDRLVSRDVRHYGLVAGLPLGISTVALAAALFWPGLTGSLACMALYFFLSWASGPPWAACIQSLAGPTNRATASAISIIAMVVFGNGLGPFLIGVLSDGFASFGFTSGAAVRLALLAGALPSLAACYLFLLARRHIAAELLEG